MPALRLTAVALVLVLAGCSTTTSGHGIEGPSSPPTSRVTSPATSPATSAVASPGPSDSSAPRCAQPWVSQPGAPFCYVLPTGFADSSELTSYGHGWTYKTLISAAQYDSVEVLAARLPFNSDAYGDAVLQIYTETYRYRAGKLGITRASDLSPTRVAGARAYEQTWANTADAAGRTIFIFRGTTEVLLQCEHRDLPQRANAGCKSVLSTLQIVSLG